MLVERLRAMQPELGITERDVRCVQLAGLCHDLGHGPWSHVWDGHFIPEVLPDQKWTHEDASEMMFDDLVRQNNIPFDEGDVNFVKDLIKGSVCHTAHSKPPEKKFLFDIVANRRNGIDVDKFDYIARDVRAIGDHNNFSSRRLIDSARVINDEICYHIKDANSVYELFSLRFSNHKRIYSHKTARAIEYMIVDALKAAEPSMKIAKHILDPVKYVYLTDNILERIEMSEDPSLEESRKIIERIRRRELYRCVDWGTFPYNALASLKETITPDHIVRSAKGLFNAVRTGKNDYTAPSKHVVTGLSPEHVVVDFSVLHHGMKEKNPIDSVRFYGKHNINKSFKAEPGELSTLMPACFAEIQLRVYTKESIFYGLVQAGYRELLLALSDDAAPPYLNLNSSPSPSVTEPPSTPRMRATASPPGSRNMSFLNLAKTPSFTAPNKFTKVDASFAPPSPSLSAKRDRLSVPLESRFVIEPSLVVQDSLASVTTEAAQSDAGTSSSAQTAVEDHTSPTRSNQVPTDTDEPKTPRKLRGASSQELILSPSPNITPRSAHGTRRRRTNSVNTLDEGKDFCNKKRRH
ncbi:uncharacterized protein FOMMEDRAFT_125131 [Fomitiporia mediterranea MF3/22]|uniref:uncharacterized protein n=1 Tax=Fomitiporia mediterranea (strain MF3/22) TaxID=694068 RepID=UPI0004408803|nr:uncharacterized protein FOMMEDRAFT_125131 [Fomitiporia mediterranea MF3/22]EJD00742.1 hypothetical protein FOMMEDRAFT_125131 [Fomitiporia mediterranea MF3/22]